MIQPSRRWVMSISIVIVILIVGLYITSIFQANQANQSVSITTSTVSTKQASLTITNKDAYKNDISSTDFITAESGILNHLKKSGADTTQYKGVVRDKSLTKTVSDGATQTTILVDIASMKQTYKVIFNNDPTTGYAALLVRCPDANELIYPAFACKDDRDQ